MANGSPRAHWRIGSAAALCALALLACGCAMAAVPADDPDSEIIAAQARLAALIAESRWQPDPHWTALRSADAVAGQGTSGRMRWRLGSVEEVWSRTEADAEADDEALAHLARDPQAVDALILWARRHPAQAAAESHRLAALVTGDRPVVTSLSLREWTRRIGRFIGSGENPGESRLLDLNTRAAAAEAWCLVLAAGDGDVLDRFAPAGRVLEREQLPDAVRHELWIGMCRSVPPAAVPGLEAALLRDAPATPTTAPRRRAALDACTVYALRQRVTKEPARFDATAWPPALLVWAERPREVLETDPPTRRRFGLWLAAAGHRNAVDVLRQQLADHDPHVRNAALESLGVLGGGETVATLERYADRPEPLVRAAAVRGLGRCAPSAVSRHAADGTAAVRVAVAESLRSAFDLTAAQAMTRLVTDRSTQVSEAAVRSLAHWPDEWAVPVLAAGIMSGSPSQRTLCRDELVRRFGDDVPPLAEHDPAAMHAELTVWAAAHDLPLTLADDYRGTMSADRHPQFVPSDHVDPEALSAAIERLETGDIETRRSAAQSIAEVGRMRSLTPVEVQAVGDRLAGEPDPLVWRSVFAAIERDSHAAVDRIVRLAAIHADPDIRQLACRHAARHAHAGQAGWLRRMLHDPRAAVRLAAVEACGHCPDPGLVDDLRRLLIDADRRIVLAAAEALSRHGDMAGRRELARMLWHPDAGVRRAAVAAAAESGDAWFVEPLVRIAADERDPATLRGILDGLERLVPPENRPAGLAKAATTRVKIAAWIAWQRSRGDAVSGSFSSRSFGRSFGNSLRQPSHHVKEPADDRHP